MVEQSLGLAFFGGVLFVGLVYFIYTKWQASKAKKAERTGKAGGSARPDIKEK